MFTIEHGFEATSITLIDDTVGALLEDVCIKSYEDRIVIEQWDATRNRMHGITLSMNQAHDLPLLWTCPKASTKGPSLN